MEVIIFFKKVFQKSLTSKVLKIISIWIFSILVNMFFINFSWAERYELMWNKYQEYVKLENNVFENLRFHLSHFQLREGIHLKLTLEDQLGRMWIFKFKRSTNDIIAYRVFAFLGINSPEIHHIYLNINGKRYGGSIQRYISHKGSLSNFSIQDLTPEALSDLLKIHILDWLMSNWDCAPGQFLVHSVDKKGKGKDIFRIDNDSAFKFYGKDNLAIGYYCPYFDSPDDSFYNRLWQAYLEGRIKLNFIESYNFAKFIQSIPDKYFAYLIQPFISKEKWKSFIYRKLHVSEDIKAFYEDIFEKAKSAVELQDDEDYEMFLNKIISIFDYKIQYLRDIKKKLGRYNKRAQSEIRARISYKGYLMMKRVYERYWLADRWRWLYPSERNKTLLEVCQEALEELRHLQWNSNSKEEKEALILYEEEVKKIMNGKKPSYHFFYINRIVDVFP